jgi:hypothetical protein
MPSNREQRRHPDKLRPPGGSPSGDAAPPAAGPPRPGPQDAMRGNDRQQDDLSVRAKNSGHGKKTADKWNQ